MTEQEAATTSYKDQGNEEFRQGSYLKAAATYTRAIKETPDDAVLHSNRCAALLKLTKLQKALGDADSCIKLRPDWDKGHFRRGAVLEAMQRTEEALSSYQEALRHSPGNTEINAKIKNLQRCVRKQQQATQQRASPIKQAEQAGPPTGSVAA